MVNWAIAKARRKRAGFRGGNSGGAQFAGERACPERGSVPHRRQSAMARPTAMILSIPLVQPPRCAIKWIGKAAGHRRARKSRAEREQANHAAHACLVGGRDARDRRAGGSRNARVVQLYPKYADCRHLQPGRLVLLGFGGAGQD